MPAAGGGQAVSPLPESAAEVQALFCAFTDAYPKKHGLSRTLPLFTEALGCVRFERMMDVLERQKRSRDWTKEDGRYVPCAEKWLRGHGWEDEPEPVFEDRYVCLNRY